MLVLATLRSECRDDDFATMWRAAPVLAPLHGEPREQGPWSGPSRPTQTWLCRNTPPDLQQIRLLGSAVERVTSNDKVTGSTPVEGKRSIRFLFLLSSP